jgi:deazaflavin-dependent oxidoreductase (nitroreductase family)
MLLEVRSEPHVPDRSSALSEVNRPVIEEFRANNGRVTQSLGGAVAHIDLLLLHHTGKKSGNSYINPVGHVPHDGSYLLLGSFGGAPDEPLWVANVEAAGTASVEFADRTETVRVTVLRDGDERELLYNVLVAAWPFVVTAYEPKTLRSFPVIRLDPTGETA